MCREEGFRRGRTAENRICLEQRIVQDAVVLHKVRADSGEFHIAAPAGVLGAVDITQQLGSTVKGSVDNIHSFDALSTQDQRQPNVPVCLLARSEYHHGPHALAFVEGHGGGQGSAEGGEFVGVDQSKG